MGQGPVSIAENHKDLGFRRCGGGRQGCCWSRHIAWRKFPHGWKATWGTFSWRLFVSLDEEQEHSYSAFKTQLRCYLLRNPSQMPGGRARSPAGTRAPPHLVLYGIQWGSFYRHSGPAVNLEREEPSGARWLWKVVEQKWAPIQGALMDKGKAGGSLDRQPPEDGHPDLLATHMPQNRERGLQSGLLGTPTWVGGQGQWAVLVNRRARLFRV